jgi:ArsR family transcriptional regulator, arsenate/arsenite/antimonite-responsive transcriptional repressor
LRQSRLIMTKADLFNKEIQDKALVFKALSHPARIAILLYLAKTKTCISGDISNEIPLSRTTVTQHLQELKKAGLIKGEIEGVRKNYCLCNSCISDIKQMISSFLEEISVETKNNC